MAALAIAAVGLVSSVGRGIVDSCASIRAGINRACSVSHVATLGDDPGEPSPLIGHPIVGLTDGFGPNARWLTMSRRALVDLRAGNSAAARDDATYWVRCGIVFLLPVLKDARFFHAIPARPDAIWATYLDPLIKAQRLAFHPERRVLLQTGPGGIGQAFELSGTWLERREVDRVIIVAADSLLDAWSLSWLAGAGRLRSAENPVGTTPGEAAVALLVERSADNRKARPPAFAKAIACAEIDEPFPKASRRNGRGLGSVIERAIGEAGARVEGDIYVNLNGEEWRAAEFGGALATLGAGTLGEHRVVTPATSVGDVGAAAGALHVACAVRSFERQYSMSSRAWILSTSDYGDASAIQLEAA